jgi:hypothetical protein
MRKEAKKEENTNQGAAPFGVQLLIPPPGNAVAYPVQREKRGEIRRDEKRS